MSEPERLIRMLACLLLPYVSIRQLSIRQRKSAYVSVRQHMSASEYQIRMPPCLLLQLEALSRLYQGSMKALSKIYSGSIQALLFGSIKAQLRPAD